MAFSKYITVDAMLESKGLLGIAPTTLFSYILCAAFQPRRISRLDATTHFPAPCCKTGVQLLFALCSIPPSVKMEDKKATNTKCIQMCTSMRDKMEKQKLLKF